MNAIRRMTISLAFRVFGRLSGGEPFPPMSSQEQCLPKDPVVPYSIGRTAEHEMFALVRLAATTSVTIRSFAARVTRSQTDIPVRYENCPEDNSTDRRAPWSAVAEDQDEPLGSGLGSFQR